MDPTVSAHQIMAKFVKGVTEILAMIRQAFGEESMRHTHVFERIRSQKGRQVRSHELGQNIL
jgi:hypothetical protein